jgi:hypothetical protein
LPDLNPEQWTAVAAGVAALVAVIGTVMAGWYNRRSIEMASRHNRRSIEALELPFLIPNPGMKEQWRLQFETGSVAHVLRVPMHNVGMGPAMMGDVQLIAEGTQILSQAGGMIPFRPNEDQSLPLQLLGQPPEPECEGELRVYYSHASGTQYMTRCHIKIDQAGVLPTSFSRELSDGKERRFLFQSEPVG